MRIRVAPLSELPETLKVFLRSGFPRRTSATNLQFIHVGFIDSSGHYDVVLITVIWIAKHMWR